MPDPYRSVRRLAQSRGDLITPLWYEALYDHFPDYDEEPYAQNTVDEVDFVERQIDHDRSKRILDVGCGTGRHALELARRGYDVVGVDLSASMIDQGREVARAEGVDVTFTVGDARALPYDADFDVALVLCEGGFSLMETDAMDRLILQNVARALRPGGELLMTAPHAAFPIAHEPEEGTFDLVTFRETFEIETT
ncbi:MAG: class I SAM-dependent methyltransferase, partial [Chloroflexota bacterium]